MQETAAAGTGTGSRRRIVGEAFAIIGSGLIVGQIDDHPATWNAGTPTFPARPGRNGQAQAVNQLCEVAGVTNNGCGVSCGSRHHWSGQPGSVPAMF